MYNILANSSIWCVLCHVIEHTVYSTMANRLIHDWVLFNVFMILFNVLMLQGLENRVNTELTSPIPISGRSADHHQYGDHQYGDESSASRETILNSLPRANPIEHWNR